MLRWPSRTGQGLAARKARWRAPVQAALAPSVGVLWLSATLAASAQTLPPAMATERAPAVAAVPAPPLAEGLKPGQFRWSPQIAPQGPLLIVVDLSAQLAYVYRNGVRIGLSTISSGKPGYETPTGVFTILQKDRKHHSNKYDNAPMPFMQRLTWDGIALHAGKLPGRPASHGCVRLPYAFSEALFGVTSTGMTVVVADGTAAPPEAAAPSLIAPADAAAPTPPPADAAAPTPPPAEADPATADAVLWRPELSPSGPLSVVLGTRDQYVRVLRNGMEIGHAPLHLRGAVPPGTRAYMVLAGSTDAPSPVVAGRPGLRWLAVSVPRKDEGVQALQDLTLDGRLEVPSEFARAVYDALVPGSVLVTTDEPVRNGPMQPATILWADPAAAHEPAKRP
ncbi:MAG: L,D-transpeptidase family protein [Proteobacteria bacterium]|nr:L,D-transpeptidase family protein [Pseudomonadota bacterium]MBS0465359.1 L,D-transpeptidase family protein [Pseudomonadota bacterium]